MSQPTGRRAHDPEGEFLHPSSFLADWLPDPSIKPLTPRRRNRINADGRGQALNAGSSISCLELLCQLCLFSQQREQRRRGWACTGAPKAPSVGFRAGLPPPEGQGANQLPGAWALTQGPNGRLVPGSATYRPSDTAALNLGFLTCKTRPLMGPCVVTQILSSRIQAARGHTGPDREKTT